jgi:branched-chain amino acid transport system permease protein
VGRGGLLRDTLHRWPYRNETLLLAVLLVATLFFRFPGNNVTLGIYGTGLVGGAALAMQAIAIVLVYRSNRIINFAQFAFGSTSALIFGALVHAQPLLRVTHTICPPCLPRITSTEQNVNYVVSLVLALSLSMLLAWLVYRLVVRRFDNAPRLVLTVATIFVAQGLPTLAAAFEWIAQHGLPAREVAVSGATAAVVPPVDFRLTISQGGVPVVFHLVDVLTVVLAVVATIGISVYMRRSATGNAIRAASENPARASTLGVDVGRVTGRVWLLAGLLSGISGLLIVSQAPITTGIDVGALVQILLVAVLARLVSLPMAAAAAVVVGVFGNSVTWAFQNTDAYPALLFVLVAVALLAQRYQVSRADLDLASSWQSSKEARPVPVELRSLPAVRKWRWTLAILLGVVLCMYPFVMSPGDIGLGTLAMLYGMLGLSLLILAGWSGQISLGHVGLAAVGAYVAAVSHAPFVVQLLIGSIAGGLAALAIGLPALRLRGLHLAVISMAFSFAVVIILLGPKYLGQFLPTDLGTPSLFGWHIGDGAPFYFLTLGLLAAVTTLMVGMRRTRTGRALLAGRDNERSAQSFGIGLTRTRLSAFAVSGCIAGLAGTLLAWQGHDVNPQNFAPNLSLSVFLYMVIGGTGAVCGPLIGAGYAWIAFIGGLTPILDQALTGLGGLVLLLFFPGGLARLGFDLRDAGLRRIASRHRILVPSLMADRDLRRVDDRASLAAKQARRGGTVFVPSRYALDAQWITEVPGSIVAPGGTTTRAAARKVGTRAAFTGLSADTEPAGVTSGG